MAAPKRPAAGWTRMPAEVVGAGELLVRLVETMAQSLLRATCEAGRPGIGWV